MFVKIRTLIPKKLFTTSTALAAICHCIALAIIRYCLYWAQIAAAVTALHTRLRVNYLWTVVYYLINSSLAFVVTSHTSVTFFQVNDWIPVFAHNYVFYMFVKLRTMFSKKIDLCVRKITNNIDKNKKNPRNFSDLGTRSRGRTGTAITGHRILSPACLPIPPFEQPLNLVR